MPPPAPEASPGRWRRRRAALGLVAIMAAAAALRAWPASAVFTADGVRLTGDDDPAYHVLQAERLLRGDPGAPWVDPGLNYPRGSVVPWPPLFDVLLAGAARIGAPSGPPERAHVAGAASVVPVVLAVLTVPVIAALAEGLAGAGALLAALLFALLPAHAIFSMVGRPDQHVLELLLSSLALLAIVPGLRDPARPPWRHRALLAVALAAAFWTWTGSALYPLFLVGFTGALFVVAPAGAPVARRLASDLGWGAGGAVALLAASVAVARGPAILANVSLSGVTAFPAVLLGMTAVFGGAVALAAARAPLSRTAAVRAAWTVAAAALPLAGALAIPAVRDAVAHGLTPLARANDWYRNVQEFDPLLLAGYEPIGAELVDLVGLYGLALFAMPLAAAPLVRRLVRNEEPRAPLALLLAWGAFFLVLGLARQRFALYLVAPLAVWVGGAWHGAAVWAHRRWRPAIAACFAAGIGALLIAPALAQVRTTLAGEAPEHAAVRALLERVPGLPVVAGRPSVYSEWSHGHLVQYASGRPTLVSPFGTEGGEGAMEDAAAFFFAADPGAAEALLARRRIGLVLLRDPITEAYFGHAFAPAGTPPLVDLRRSARFGMDVRVRPELRSIVPARLFYDDGSATYGLEALGGFRLLDESDAAPGGGHPPFKVFGWVPGARVRVSGARRGDPVDGVIQVTTLGRRFVWRTRAVADEAGNAELRVPYATGRNGGADASALLIAAPTGSAQLQVTETAVTDGADLRVAVPR